MNTKHNYKDILLQQIPFCLKSTCLPSLGRLYRGKVRDCYVRDGERIIITTDRVSAFDVVLGAIPFKGEILTQIALFWFEHIGDIVPTHFLSSPHPNVLVVKELNILPVEVIVREYITGSAWRDYEAGRDISGIVLPKGLKKNEKLQSPIITPSTKAKTGEHDKPISVDEILSSGLVAKDLWEQIEDISLRLFTRGREIAKERGLILVDTKYEFGIDQNQQLMVADEVHTLDSSRFWKENSYYERFENSQEPEMLDKEPLRQWLLSKGYSGEGTPPTLGKDTIVEFALKYIEAYRIILQKDFAPKIKNPLDDIKRSLSAL